MCIRDSADAFQKRFFQSQRIGRRKRFLFQLQNVAGDLALNGVRRAGLQQTVGSRNLVHESHRKKEKRGHLVDAGSADHRDVVQLLNHFVAQSRRKSCQFAVDVVLPLHHQKRPGGDAGAAAHFAQNRRHKTRQSHGTIINVLAPEPFCLRHAVILRADALALGHLHNAAKFAAGAPVSVLRQKGAAFVGNDASQPRGPCESGRTFFGKGEIKILGRHEKDVYKRQA